MKYSDNSVQQSRKKIKDILVLQPITPEKPVSITLDNKILQRAGLGSEQTHNIHKIFSRSRHRFVLDYVCVK